MPRNFRQNFDNALSKQKIILADDDPIIISTIGKSLSLLHAEVHTASNGKQAWELFQTISPTLVITDIEMPFMSGIELLSCIQEKEPDFPVIIMTGLGDLSTAIDAMKGGACDYLKKPFTLNEMISRIKSSIKKQSLIQKIKELELNDNLTQNHKLFSRLGGNMAHLFNNLTTPLVSSLDLWEEIINILNEVDIENKYSNLIEKGKKIITNNKNSSDKLRKTLQVWWKLSEPVSEKNTSTCIHQVIESSILLTQQELFLGNNIELNIPHDLPKISCDFSSLTRLISHLLLNSASSLKEMKKIHPEFQGIVKISGFYKENSIILELSDNGIGIEEFILEKVKKQLRTPERIFSVAQSGFYNCYGLIYSMRGEMEVHSSGKNSGCIIQIRLPIIERQL